MEMEKIKVLNIETRASKHGWQAAHPEMECELFNEFREKRHDENPVKKETKFWIKR